MQIDAVEEWRRLTGHYRSLSEGELRKLSFEFGDLTELAKQVLRDELRLRGLNLPQKAADTPQEPAPRLEQSAMGQYTLNPYTLNQYTPTQHTPEQFIPDQYTVERSTAPSHPNQPADAGDGTEATRMLLDYTWKTQLCECENAEQAWQLWEVLRRAGIESWVEGAESTGSLYGRILVAADELDKARIVVSRPIPQDVIDESRTPQPEFSVPNCPTCGADDPLLESVDPVNTWLCESCGREWSDPAGKTADPRDERQNA